MHNFFNNKNVLYSEIINTEVILFPLLKKMKNILFIQKIISTIIGIKKILMS